MIINNNKNVMYEHFKYKSTILAFVEILFKIFNNQFNLYVEIVN